MPKLGAGRSIPPSARGRFGVVGAKLLPSTGNALLDFLREDWYYPLLAVMCIPATLVAVYLNWLGMKFFQRS
jgi:phosphatidylinositol glycan anchor class Y biosynthesis protein